MKACELSISRHYQNYIAQCCFLTERSVKKNTYTRHADYKTLRRLQIISNNPFVFFHRKLIDVNRCNSRFQLSFSSKCFQWVKVCGMFLPTFVYDSYLRLRDAKGREAMTKYPEIKQLWLPTFSPEKKHYFVARIPDIQKRIYLSHYWFNTCNLTRDN